MIPKGSYLLLQIRYDSKGSNLLLQIRWIIFCCLTQKQTEKTKRYNICRLCKKIYDWKEKIVKNKNVFFDDWKLFLGDIENLDL